MSQELNIEEILKDISLEMLESIDATVIYAADNLDRVIVSIANQAATETIDLLTEKGRKTIASRAHRVSRYKTTLDDKGEELVADAKQTIKAVGDIRKSLREKLDAVRDGVRKPLTDWEQAEEKRQSEIESRMTDLLNCKNISTNLSVKDIQLIIWRAAEIYQFDWQEFAELAETNYNEVKKTLEEKLAALRQYEADLAELKRLREEKAAREAKEKAEREERERIEAAAATAAAYTITAQYLQPPESIAPPIEPRPEVSPVSTGAAPAANAHFQTSPNAHFQASPLEVEQIDHTDLINVIREMKPLIPAANLVRLQHRTLKIIEAIMKMKEPS